VTATKVIAATRLLPGKKNKHLTPAGLRIKNMANDITITGTVQIVFDRIDTQGTNGTFSKRDIVVRTDEQYPQDIAVQFTQDKCDFLDNYKPGDRVVIAYNLRGKLGGWTNPQGEVKYFNTIQGWKINKERAEGQAQTTPAATQPAAPSAPAAPGQKVYVHTDKTFTKEQYLATPGWTVDLLVAQKKGHWQTTPAAPVAPAQVQLGDDGVPF
jgi:hypothetical protein